MDWSYIAGFFDGEGNINISISKNKSANIQIRIYNKDINVLNEIKNFIKMGRVYSRKRLTPKLKEESIMNELTITDKESCLKFLRLIYPYSISKKEQVDYLLNNFKFELGSGNKEFNKSEFNILKPRLNKT